MEDVPLTNQERAIGGSRKAFRRLREWTIRNKILYGILFSYDIKLSELAEEIGVTPRTVQAWVFEGRLPNKENRAELSRILGYPEYILFYDLN